MASIYEVIALLDSIANDLNYAFELQLEVGEKAQAAAGGLRMANEEVGTSASLDSVSAMLQAAENNIDELKEAFAAGRDIVRSLANLLRG